MTKGVFGTIMTPGMENSVYLLKDFPTDKASADGLIRLLVCDRELRHQLDFIRSPLLADAIMNFVESDLKDGVLSSVRNVFDGKGQRVGFDIFIIKCKLERLGTILPEPSLRFQFRILNPAVDKKDGTHETIVETRLELPVILKECTFPQGFAKWRRPLSAKMVTGKQITCDVILEWAGPSEPRPITMNENSFGQNLFSREDSKDLVVMAGNGAEIKCHRIIFEAHSEVLAAMLSPKTSMKESKSGRVELKENSEDGLTRLIRYFYGLELATSDLTCDVAVELLKTAHRYKLSQLVGSLIRMFLDRESDWFTANDLVELYFHAKNLVELKEWKELVDHSLQMMLSFYPAIKTCERFLEIYRTDVDSAVDFIWKLFEVERNQKGNPPVKRKVGE